MSRLTRKVIAAYDVQRAKVYRRPPVEGEGLPIGQTPAQTLHFSWCAEFQPRAELFVSDIHAMEGHIPSVYMRGMTAEHTIAMRRRGLMKRSENSSNILTSEPVHLPLPGFVVEAESGKPNWRKFVKNVGDGRVAIKLIKKS